MKNSKLIHLLSTFSKDELHTFGTFLDSSFLNPRSELSGLLKVLRKQSKDFSNNDLNKHTIFSSIFPDQEFDDQQLHYFFNYLLRAAEKFLGFQKLKGQPNTLSLLITEALLEKQLPKHYNYWLQKAEGNLYKQELPSLDQYYQQYKLSDFEATYHSLEQGRAYNQALQQASNHLDKFYILAKLRYCCTMLNNQQYLPENFELPLLEEIQTYLKTENVPNDPIINGYLLVIELLKSVENHEPYDTFRQFLNNSIKSFKREEQQAFLYYAINYCIGALRRGEKEFAEEALSFYLLGIDLKALIHDDYLAHWDYKNIIKLALGLNKYDWVADFIQNYSKLLAPKYRDNALSYNLAELNYHKKDYDQALDLLQKVTYTDIYYNLDSKVMLLKIYYELDELEPLLSLLASFMVFIKRKKSLSENAQKSYHNFCKLLLRMVRQTNKDLKNLGEDIKNTPLVSSRQWLQKHFLANRSY